MTSSSSSETPSETTSSSESADVIGVDAALPDSEFTVIACSITPVVETCLGVDGVLAVLKKLAKDYGLPVTELVNSGYVVALRGRPQSFSAVVNTELKINDAS